MFKIQKDKTLYLPYILFWETMKTYQDPTEGHIPCTYLPKTTHMHQLQYNQLHFCFHMAILLYAYIIYSYKARKGYTDWLPMSEFPQNYIIEWKLFISNL